MTAASSGLHVQLRIKYVSSKPIACMVAAVHDNICGGAGDQHALASSLEGLLRQPLSLVTAPPSSPDGWCLWRRDPPDVAIAQSTNRVQRSIATPTRTSPDLFLCGVVFIHNMQNFQADQPLNIPVENYNLSHLILNPLEVGYRFIAQQCNA